MVIISRRLLLILILLLTTSKASLGQSTSVSATITDAGGQAWIGGTYTFTTSALGQTPITGTLDGSGAFTSLTFPHNSFTSAVGDVWTARICPDATAPCYTKTVTISGATQSLSATLIPAAIALTLPPYPAAISTVRAYADAEIVSTPKGGQYFNTISGTQRQCTTVSGTTCTVWAAAGGFSSPMTTLGDLIAEDATPTPVRLPGPTTPNGVPQVFTSTPSGGLATLPAWGLPGLVPRSVIGTTATDTIASADCSPKGIFYQGSVAVAVTLPTATTLAVPNCVFTLTNNTSGSSTAVTVTPTTWTVAPGGASLAIAQGRSCRFTVDSAVVTQWDADCHDLPLVAGSNITITRGQYGPTVSASGGGAFPLTVSGTVTSGGIPYFNSTTAESSSALLTTNVLVKGGGAGGAPANSLTTDDGTTSTYTGTGGTKSPVFTATGTTAGFVDFPQGSTSAAVAPCNTATSICEQAPAAVTSYLVNKPGVSATGITTNNVSAAVITQGISGDANHSATVTIGSGTSIGSTTLCSSTNCPAGTYVVHTYIDITTACGTTGTYVVNLIYTDDQGAKTIPVNINGTGAVPATGVLTTTSTANFGESSQVIRLTSGNLNYSTTAVACGTAGPMVGNLYMAVVPVM